MTAYRKKLTKFLKELLQIAEKQANCDNPNRIEENKYP
jgi:hypothetical protein